MNGVSAGRLISLRSVPSALTLFVASFPICSTAGAQQQVSTVMELGGTRLAVSAQEMRVLSALGSVARGAPVGAQNRALAEARRVSNSRDARYALALYELEIGRQREDDAMRAAALDALIASKTTGRDRLPGFLGVRGQIAFRAGDVELADRSWTRLAELTPADPEVFANLAQVHLAKGDAPGAMDLLARAMSVRQASGQAAAEAWYRQRLSIALHGKLVSPGTDAARALVAAYPTPTNWRIALTVYRQLTAPEGFAEIALFRLMRHVDALTDPAEYQRVAQLLRQSGEPREAKSVLNEGLVRGLLNAQSSPTREIIAEVDRANAAQPKGVATAAPNKEDAALRRGTTLLLAGQRAAAATMFRSVAADPAAGRFGDLAAFWLIVLNRKRPPSSGAIARANTDPA